jgi:hypothetical protein
LQWYDFGARMLDSAIGRWFVQDPAAEKSPNVSPYSYVLNNPLRYVDPDGRQGREAFGVTWVWPWDPDAAGFGETAKAYVDAAGVAASGAIAGAGGGAATGCAAGAVVGAVGGAGVGAAPGCGVGAVGGLIGGFFAGLISAAFADTPADAAKTGVVSGLLAGPFGGASAAVEAGWGVVGSGAAATAVTPTVVETTNAQLAKLANFVESHGRGLRWVAGDAELHAAYEAARPAVGSRAGRAAFNKLRREMGKLLAIKGRPIHHWLFPITEHSAEAVSATNLYLAESQSVHNALHQAIGTLSKPFAEMALSTEKELQSMFNFWLAKP